MLSVVARSKLLALSVLLLLLASTSSVLALESPGSLSLRPSSQTPLMRVLGLKAGLSNGIECNNNPINYVDPEGLCPVALPLIPPLISATEAVVIVGSAAAPLVWEAGQRLGEKIKESFSEGLLEAGAGAGQIGPSYIGGGDNDFRDGSLRNVFSKSNRSQKTERAEIPISKPGKGVAKPARDVKTAESALDQLDSISKNQSDPRTPKIDTLGKSPQDARQRIKEEYINKGKK